MLEYSQHYLFKLVTRGLELADQDQPPENSSQPDLRKEEMPATQTSRDGRIVFIVEEKEEDFAPEQVENHPRTIE